jgi:hypothetical protein
MHCLNCGAEMPDKVTVCVKCGSRTDVSAFAVDVGQLAAPATARGKMDAQPKSSSATRAVITLVFIVALVLLVWWVAGSR